VTLTVRVDGAPVSFSPNTVEADTHIIAGSISQGETYMKKGDTAYFDWEDVLDKILLPGREEPEGEASGTIVGVGPGWAKILVDGPEIPIHVRVKLTKLRRGSREVDVKWRPPHPNECPACGAWKPASWDSCGDC
jgi:hypothetical protein